MLFPNAFTEMIKEEYRAFRKGADHSIYAHNEVLYLKGNPGSGKTAGALDYCRLYPSTLYFSFANLDAALAPRVFAGRYPDVFRACVTWEDFFDQLYDYGIKTRCTIFFDDAATRNDKDVFIEQLRRILDENRGHFFFVVFLLKPWENLPLRAKEKALPPLSPAEIRRILRLKDEDTFRLYTLTDGTPWLLKQYDRELSFEDNVRAWLCCDSRYRRLAREWMGCCFRAPESYNTLMYGMATGMNRVSELAGLSGFPMNKVDKYLKALEAHSLALRETGEDGRTRYVPANNYLLLWYRFLLTCGVTHDGGVPEETVSAFMDYLDNVLVPTTFRRTVLQWLDAHQHHYLDKPVDIRKPYIKDAKHHGIRFDYVYKTDARVSRYIVLKLFDRLEDRCERRDWHAIDRAVSAAFSYSDTTLILASIHRFTDWLWEVTSERDNVKLVQIQTLGRA